MDDGPHVIQLEGNFRAVPESAGRRRDEKEPVVIIRKFLATVS